LSLSSSSSFYIMNTFLDIIHRWTATPKNQTRGDRILFPLASHSDSSIFFCFFFFFHCSYYTFIWHYLIYWVHIFSSLINSYVIYYFTWFLCDVSTGALDMHVNHDNGVQHLPRLENYIFEGEKQKKNNL